MRRLAKNLILATAAVSAIFLVDLSAAEAANVYGEKFFITEKICPLYTDDKQYIDFWSKFRDTVMPDPDEPQNNNPPKEMPNPKPADKPKPAEKPKPATPPRAVNPRPAN